MFIICTYNVLFAFLLFSWRHDNVYQFHHCPVRYVFTLTWQQRLEAEETCETSSIRRDQSPSVDDATDIYTSYTSRFILVFAVVMM